MERLAIACGVRVAELNAIDLNISQDSPCFAGFDPQALMDTADLGLLLDTDVPFVPFSADGVMCGGSRILFGGRFRQCVNRRWNGRVGDDFQRTRSASPIATNVLC